MQLNLEQVKQAFLELPFEEEKDLREWLKEQEPKLAHRQAKAEAVREQVERFRRAQKWIEEHREEYLNQ